MRVDADTQFVQQHFQAMGYTPEPIDRPGPNGRTADLWAHVGTDCLVVEVKSRTDDAETAEQLRRAPLGEILEREGDLARKNRLSSVIEEASRQIADSQYHYPGVGVLWFRAKPRLGFDDSEHQMEATLLGIRGVAWMRGDESRATTAFAATFSDFYRFPNIDATVLEVEDKGRLLLNPFSCNGPPIFMGRIPSRKAHPTIRICCLPPLQCRLSLGDCSGPPIFVDRIPSRKAHPIIRICCLPPLQCGVFPEVGSCPQLPCPIPSRYPEAGPVASGRHSFLPAFGRFVASATAGIATRPGRPLPG